MVQATRCVQHRRRNLQPACEHRPAWLQCQAADRIPRRITGNLLDNSCRLTAPIGPIADRDPLILRQVLAAQLHPACAVDTLPDQISVT